METVKRFDDRAADYVKYRPTYPRQAIAAILDGLGSPEDIVAADVGAGTGISTRGCSPRPSASRFRTSSGSISTG